MALAVIKTGNKQYKVKVGDRLKIDKINGKEGSKIEFTALLLADDKGEKIELGKPHLSKKVTAKILLHGQGRKITIVKFKRKVRYRRKRGFRPQLTQVEITGI